MMEHELVSSNLKTKEVERHHTKVEMGMGNNINVARNEAVYKLYHKITPF